MIEGVIVKDLKQLPSEPGIQYTSPQPSYSRAPYPNYNPEYAVRYQPREIQLEDEEISEGKHRKLWDLWPSLWVPLAAFIAMNALLIGILFVISILIGDVDLVLDLVSNPFFIVASSTVEILLLLIPAWYVRKYLRQPDLKKSLNLLGLTTEGLDEQGIFKEIVVGLGFAVVGIFLVAITSLIVELILSYFFGISIVSTDAPSSDVDVIISGADLISIILLALVMIFIVGPSEEVLFRGFMQKGLVRNLGEQWGIVITAFIFAIIHLLTLFVYLLGDPLTFIILFVFTFTPYFAISLMLGLLFRWRNENLIAVIVTHGFYNAITVILAFLYYGTF